MKMSDWIRHFRYSILFKFESLNAKNKWKRKNCLNG